MLTGLQNITPPSQVRSPETVYCANLKLRYFGHAGLENPVSESSCGTTCVRKQFKRGETRRRPPEVLSVKESMLPTLCRYEIPTVFQAAQSRDRVRAISSAHEPKVLGGRGVPHKANATRGTWSPARVPSNFATG